LAPAAPVRTDGTERRANNRALEYWKKLAGARPFPSRHDVSRESAADLWDNLFVVDVSAGPAAYRFVQAGGVLISALGSDPTGETLGSVLPGGMGTRTLFFLQAAVGLKGPVTDDVGTWKRADGTEILYRSILLPLSEDGDKVTALLGAFSFRTTHS
jgi:hypothetical protein